MSECRRAPPQRPYVDAHMFQFRYARGLRSLFLAGALSKPVLWVYPALPIRLMASGHWPEGVDAKLEISSAWVPIPKPLASSQSCL